MDRMRSTKLPGKGGGGKFKFLCLFKVSCLFGGSKKTKIRVMAMCIYETNMGIAALHFTYKHVCNCCTIFRRSQKLNQTQAHHFPMTTPNQPGRSFVTQISAPLVLRLNERNVSKRA